jgi:hypothetical protein
MASRMGGSAAYHVASAMLGALLLPARVSRIPQPVDLFLTFFKRWLPAKCSTCAHGRTHGSTVDGAGSQDALMLRTQPLHLIGGLSLRMQLFLETGPFTTRSHKAATGLHKARVPPAQPPWWDSSRAEALPLATPTPYAQ